MSNPARWYKYYGSYIQEEYKDAVNLLTWLGENYSINPRLLLALLEYRAQALEPEPRPRPRAKFADA